MTQSFVSRTKLAFTSARSTGLMLVLLPSFALAQVDIIFGHVAPMPEGSDTIHVEVDGNEIGTLHYAEFTEFSIPGEAREVVARSPGGELLARRSADEFTRSIVDESAVLDSFNGTLVTFGADDGDSGFDWFLIEEPLSAPSNGIFYSRIHLAPNAGAIREAAACGGGFITPSSPMSYGHGALPLVDDSSSSGSGRSGGTFVGGGSYSCAGTFTPLSDDIEFAEASVTVSLGTTLVFMAIGDGVNRPYESLWVIVEEGQTPDTPEGELSQQKYRNGFHGIWHNPDYANQGLLINEIREGVFFYWATFDEDSTPLWLYGMANPVQEGPLELDLFRYDGSLMNVPGVPPVETRWGQATLTTQDCGRLRMEFEPEQGPAGEFDLYRLGNPRGLSCQASVDGAKAGVRLYRCPPGTANEGVDFANSCDEFPIGRVDSNLLGRPNSLSSVNTVAGDPAEFQPVDILKANKLVIEGEDRTVGLIDAVANCQPGPGPQAIELEVNGLEAGMILEAGRGHPISIELPAPPPEVVSPYVQCTPRVDIRLQELGTIFELRSHMFFFIRD